MIRFSASGGELRVIACRTRIDSCLQIIPCCTKVLSKIGSRQPLMAVSAKTRVRKKRFPDQGSLF